MLGRAEARARQVLAGDSEGVQNWFAKPALTKADAQQRLGRVLAGGFWLNSDPGS